MSESFEPKNEEILEEEDLFEGSTVFSAPEEKNDKVEKPKLLKKILIGVGALAVLAGVITGIALLVDKITPDENEDTAAPEWFVLGDYVVKAEKEGSEDTFNYDAFSDVVLEGNKLTYNFYSKLGEKEEDSTMWLEKSMPAEYTSETAVASVAKAALGLKYSRVISEEIKEGVDYGFAKPKYTVTLTTYDKKNLTVTVGKQAADQSGYYVTVSGNPKVYLVRNSYVDGLVCEDKMDLTKALTVPAFVESEGSAEYYTSGAFATFDHLYFKNRNLGKTYKFITVNGDSDYSYNTYAIAEPIKRMANDAGVVPIVELFSNGISSSGLYCLTNTDADLKAFGLDDPDMEVSVKAGKQQRTVKAKLQKDGNYALIASDFDVIMKVSASSLAPVSIQEKDIYSVFLFIETLADLDKITIESSSGKNSFEIKTQYDEENDKTNITGISINGGEVTSPEEFQSYYQFLLGVSAINYDTTDISGKSAAATITMTKKDGSAATVIKYYEAENGRYQVVVNGDQMGLIGSSSFKNILKYAANVAAGKVYNS